MCRVAARAAWLFLAGLRPGVRHKRKSVWRAVEPLCDAPASTRMSTNVAHKWRPPRERRQRTAHSCPRARLARRLPISRTFRFGGWVYSPTADTYADCSAGSPPTFAPPASRRQHNVLLTAAALCTPGERVFLTLFQTRRPQHNARHHLRPAHRHHNNYPDRHILGDFDGYFFCGNHSTSTILQPTATTSMLLPHRTSSTTCSPVAATASSPTTTTTE